MELYDVIFTISFAVTFLLFNIAVGIIVYKKSYELGERHGYSKGAGFICNEIRRIITEPDPLIKTVAWIPAEERPPKKAGRYIVHIKGFAYATDLHYDERDGFYDEYDDGERVYYSVVHWAEFPELPEGEVQKEVAK